MADPFASLQLDSTSVVARRGYESESSSDDSRPNQRAANAKRQAMAQPEHTQIEKLRQDALFYKGKAKASEDKVKWRHREIQALKDSHTENMKTHALLLARIQEENAQLDKKRQLEEDRQAHQALLEEYKHFASGKDAKAKELEQSLIEKATRAQMLELEMNEKTQEHERAMIQKANEVAALRAKVVNQAGGQTPRTRKGKIMSKAQMRDVTSQVLIIPFTPIAIPSADTTNGNQATRATATGTSATLSERTLEGITNQFPPGTTVNIIVQPSPGGKQGRGKRGSNSPGGKERVRATEDEKTWKASPYSRPKNLLRETKREKFGVDTDEEFALKQSATEYEARACHEGRLVPNADDWRFDFNPGCQSKWNEIMINRIIDITIEKGKEDGLNPMERQTMYRWMQGQVTRGKEAWARVQPRGNETEAEAIERTGAYRLRRSHNARDNSSKTRKYTAREETIQMVIGLKKGTNAPDLEAWNRLLQMIRYLGYDGMSSEEEDEIVQGHLRVQVYKVLVFAWHSEDVGKYLTMVDSVRTKLRGAQKLKHAGPRAGTRVRDGTLSTSAVPTNLPKCLYNAEWIQKMSATNPVFYEDLQVSKEAFELLAASADMVQC
ncbi:hypothetical protein C8R45DRAFT_931336 [Mycena sanguinolenta]|nr:hypothetical protein C8R45DRAFT_931336 [Mycena sanguinolenta]